MRAHAHNLIWIPNDASAGPENLRVSAVIQFRVRVAGCTLRLDGRDTTGCSTEWISSVEAVQPSERSDGVDGKFKLLVEPEFGPRALFTTAFRTGIRMAKPPTACLAIGTTAQRGMGTSMEIASPAMALRASHDFRLQSCCTRTRDTVAQRAPLCLARFSHALMFTFVDKTDGGHTILAVSNFAGAAANGFLGNAYLPPGFNDLTHAGQRGTEALAGLAGQNVLIEFAPELGRALKKLHIPHIPLPPVWWTPDQ